MTKVDEKIKDRLQSVTSDKEDWFANHRLSEDQVAQLILNKYNRAIENQKKLNQLKKLLNF